MRLIERRMLDLIGKRNMTRSDVAAAIGVSPSHFRNVLKGRRRLNLKHSKRLIEMFGVERMQFAIDWDAMGIKDPLKEAR